ncbi:hypothetical protein BC835DRAFT_1309063 [Cytidiella melzeri]|nr:hypothetical protein BC835DRAFT_1309063 [Cytidiella melzeri]
MFSIKSLAVVATLAFGAISSVIAAPAPGESNNILARCGCDSASTIITDVTASVQVYTNQLRALAAADVTVDAVTPIVKGISGVLVDATVKINALVGADANIVLATVDGTAQVTVSVLAQLVATLVADIFGAIGVILNLGGVVGISAVIAVFASLGEVLGYFCCCCFSVVAAAGLDIKAAISLLIGGDILAVMARLNVSILKVALGIKL